MTLGFGFHPEARAEFFADVDWYDERQTGLGERFGSAVRSAVDDAVGAPESWPTWPGWDGEPSSGRGPWPSSPIESSTSSATTS